MPENSLTKEQLEEALRGLNIILKAVGSLTVEELLLKQQSILVQVPSEQQTAFMETVRDQVVAQFGLTVKGASDTFKQTLDDIIAQKAH
jgi:hypothetical protein